MDASPNPDHPQVVADRAFAALIRDSRTRPFEWGAHDCFMFAAAAVRARTQRDMLAELGITPDWRTALQAAAAIERAGGLRAGITRLFGEPVAILQAHAGDIALAGDPVNEGRQLLAVVHHGVLLAPSASGLAVFGLEHAVVAWRVT